MKSIKPDVLNSFMKQEAKEPQHKGLKSKLKMKPMLKFKK